MRTLLHLIKYKFISNLKLNLDHNPSSIIKHSGTFLVFTAFAIAAFLFTKEVLYYLLDTIHIGSYLLNRFISIILFIFFMSVNIGNMVVSYSTLYKSREVMYLLSKPITYTELFIIKFLDNFFYSSTTLIIIILAVLGGYGSYFHLSWSFYIISVLFMVIPFMLTAAALGVIFLMLLLLLSERIGARKVLSLFSIFYLITLLGFFQLDNPLNLVKNVMAFYPHINQYFGYLENPILKFLPNFLISDALYLISNNQTYRAIPFIILMLACSIIFVILAIMLAKRFYYKTWLISIELKFSKNKSNFTVNRFFSFRKNSLTKQPVDVILKKEFWQFVREPSQWIHLFILLSLIIIFIFSLAGINTSFIKHYNVNLITIIYLTVFIFNIFLISSISLRFVFPLVSMEGEALWKVNSSPVNTFSFMFIRYLLYLLFILTISQVLNLIVQIKFSNLLLFPSILEITFITISITELNFGLGSFYSNFKEKNPIRIASSAGASITFLLNIIYMVFLTGVLIYPIKQIFIDNRFGGKLGSHDLFLSNLIIIIVSTLITISSMLLSNKALNRDF